MKNPILQLFFSPRGRLARKSFIIAVLVWLGFYALQRVWFTQTGTNHVNFYLSLVLLFVNLQIIFCVFGKRLHDIGRSTWPLIGMFAVLIIATFAVMLNFGGLEYFETLHNNPEFVEDADALKRVQDKYQQTMAENLPKTGLILSGIPIIFTLWLAIAPGQKKTNKYGENPISNKS
jgi:uncharacterized membrane protein YhaH (DUF805 family)